MRFYRLEKPNYFKEWAYATFKALAFALIGTILIMLIAGYKFMIVSSGSMEPVLPVGSLVIVTPCERDDLELGDIVTMNAGGINLTHRVVGKYDRNNPDDVFAYLEPGDEGYDTETIWVTKGDANAQPDGPLNDEVVGKVYDSHAFGWIGTCVRYIRQNYTMLIILLIIVAVFVTVLEWLKGKMVPDDIECYELEDDEE